MLDVTGKFNKRLRGAIGSVIDRVLILDFISSSNSNSILYHKFGMPNSSNNKRYFIYGTWSNSGLLKSHERDFIQILGLHFHVLIVSNCKIVDPWILKNEYSFILRKNVGRDLGQLRDSLTLMHSLGIEPELVVWTNSSLYFNASIFMNFYNNYVSELSKKYDVVSMTDSFQVNYHLQSYFFVFNKSFLETCLEKKLNLPFKNVFFKRTLIHYGERNFVNWLKLHSFSFAPIFPIIKFKTKDLKFFNPPIDLHKELMLAGMPAFKISTSKDIEKRISTAELTWGKKISI